MAEHPGAAEYQDTHQAPGVGSFIQRARAGADFASLLDRLGRNSGDVHLAAGD
jgi:hypothetical protein